MKSGKVIKVAGQAALSFGKRKRPSFVGSLIVDVPVIALSDYEMGALKEARLFVAEIAQQLEKKDAAGAAGITYRDFKERLETGTDKIKTRALTAPQIAHQEVRSELLSTVERIYDYAHRYAEQRRPLRRLFFLNLAADTQGKAETVRALRDTLNQSYESPRQSSPVPILITEESVGFSAEIAKNIERLMVLFDTVLYSGHEYAQGAFKDILRCEDSYRKPHPKLAGWYAACDVFRIMSRNSAKADSQKIWSTYAYAVQALDYNLADSAVWGARPITPLTLIQDRLQRMNVSGYLPLDPKRQQLSAVVDRLQGYLAGLRRCEEVVDAVPVRRRGRRALPPPQPMLPHAFDPL